MIHRPLPDLHGLTLQPNAIVPVTVLSGFLGSGKTTIIRNFLSQSSDTAVIVNEFGEIGIDHLLMETSDENIALLPGGCLCCQANNDLVRALRSLQDQCSYRQNLSFRRVIVETSGLADPAPILQTFLDDPLRLSHYRLAGLVTTADALLGAGQLANYRAAQNQIALADRILITKHDLANQIDREQLTRSIICYNGHAELEDCAKDTELSRQLFTFENHIRGRWRAVAAIDNRLHNKTFATFSLNWQGHLDLAKLHGSLIGFARHYDDSLLRLKGIVNGTGSATPAKIHAVQHLVERPRLMSEQPSDRWRGVVVICKADVEREILARLKAILQESSLERLPLSHKEIERV